MDNPVNHRVVIAWASDVVGNILIKINILTDEKYAQTTQPGFFPHYPLCSEISVKHYNVPLRSIQFFQS